MKYNTKKNRLRLELTNDEDLAKIMNQPQNQ